MLLANYVNSKYEGTFGIVEIISPTCVKKSFKKRKTLEDASMIINELIMLSHLSKCVNGNFVKAFPYTQLEDMSTHILLEKCDCNLMQLHNYQPITLDCVTNIFFSLIDSLNIMHNRLLYHCDIKLENILYKFHSQEVIIADFGLTHFSIDNFDISRQFDFDICSETYSPIEIILHNECICDIENPSYEKVDVASLAITIIQLLTNINIFSIVPNDELKSACILYGINNLSGFTKYVNNITTNDNPTTDLFPSIDFLFEHLHVVYGAKLTQLIDLLKHMLNANTNHRYSIKQIIKHPFFISNNFKPTEPSLSPNEKLINIKYNHNIHSSNSNSVSNIVENILQQLIDNKLLTIKTHANQMHIEKNIIHLTYDIVKNILSYVSMFNETQLDLICIASAFIATIIQRNENTEFEWIMQIPFNTYNISDIITYSNWILSITNFGVLFITQFEKNMISN